MENNNLKYIDSHCHLQDYLEGELPIILERCRNINLNILYTNATNKEDFDKNIIISQNINKNNDAQKIIPGVGYHPWSLAYPINNESKWFEEFKDYIKINLIDKSIKFFIGEIGIDGGKIKKTYSLEKQIDIFKKQLEYANEYNLLVHIHCVYEWDKLFKIMNEINLKNLINNNKILLHSFQGKLKHIKKFSELNCYFSISSGCFIEKNFEMLKALPADKILFESDSPSMFNKNVYTSEEEYKDFYNTKEPNRKINSPESIKFLCKKLAELRGVSVSELNSVVYNNSLKILKEFI